MATLEPITTGQSNPTPGTYMNGNSGAHAGSRHGFEFGISHPWLNDDNSPKPVRMLSQRAQQAGVICAQKRWLHQHATVDTRPVEFG